MAQVDIKMTSDTAQATAGIGRVSSHLGVLGQQLQQLKAIGMAYFSVTGIYNLARDTLAWSDNVSTLSQQLGISISVLQTLQYVAIRNNMEWATMEQLFRRLRVALDDAASGVPRAVEIMQTLGLSMQDIQSADMTRGIQAFAAAAVSASTKVRTAFYDITGTKVGPRAIGALKYIEANGLDAIAESLRKVGKIAGDDTVNGIANADQAIKELHQTTKTFSATGMSNLLSGLKLMGFMWLHPSTWLNPWKAAREFVKRNPVPAAENREDAPAALFARRVSEAENRTRKMLEAETESTDRNNPAERLNRLYDEEVAIYRKMKANDDVIRAERDKRAATNASQPTVVENEALARNAELYEQLTKVHIGLRDAKRQHDQQTQKIAAEEESYNVSRLAAYEQETYWQERILSLQEQINSAKGAADPKLREDLLAAQKEYNKLRDEAATRTAEAKRESKEARDKALADGREELARIARDTTGERVAMRGGPWASAGGWMAQASMLAPQASREAAVKSAIDKAAASMPKAIAEALAPEIAKLTGGHYE